uniref:ATP synthase complex subunit 8 n=1 Tax=Ditaxis biseriata TaxID=560959 RepID=C8YXH2_DITBI|nr:ATP synthase F0 subunit 8 [Ditaxis biseriata]ACO92606.1 ATP synthase F0 subunit 8 [Ditaxis biseriata]
MPQMSPLNWWFLFLYFLIIFVMFNIMNYYIITYNNPSSSKMSFIKKTLNWKW